MQCLSGEFYRLSPRSDPWHLLIPGLDLSRFSGLPEFSVGPEPGSGLERRRGRVDGGYIPLFWVCGSTKYNQM